MIKGIVAIVGRPNVGKSTLFNKITKSAKAIVNDMPGVTRDRIYGYGEDPDSEHRFAVIDTGGFETKDFYFQPFARNIVWDQTRLAIDECDLVVFVVDAKTGLHPHDKDIYSFLITTGKPVLTVCNKVDGIEHQSATFEFYGLGLDDIHSMSAAHNRGVGELKEAIIDRLNELDSLKRKKDDPDAIPVAIVGRPNAGKSSILNRLVGEDRSLVSEVAGTTRDAVDAVVKFNGASYRIVDTAGIRRKTKIHEKIESLSVIKSIQAIEEADVVLMVVTPEGIADQDARLLSLCANRFKPVILVMNKWDLVEDKQSNTMRDMTEDLRHSVKTMDYMPIVFTSCETGHRVASLMPRIEALYAQYQKRVPTAKVNEVLEKAVHRHTPQLIRNHTKRIKFFFASQVAIKPPTFVIKCNVAEEIKESYKRYLTHKFQQQLGFEDLPIKVFYRGKKEEKGAKYAD